MKWIDGPEIQVPYYTFEMIEESGTAVCGFTTRLYRKDSMIDDFFQPLHRPDSDPAQVAACDRLLLAQFGTDPDHRVQAPQVHRTHIYMVTQKDLGPKEKRPVIDEADGLITNIPGVMLQTFGADCHSVYMLDPVHRAIGLCHSGRKGTQHHIVGKMLTKMQKEYGTDPGDVLAAVSPGICADCYEVGDDVAEDFLADYGSGISAKRIARKYEDGRYHLDMNAAIAETLMDAGVPYPQIEISDLCTRCRSDLFYSYRAQGCITNENSAVLMLR